MSYQQASAPVIDDSLFTKIDDFESRIRVLERQGYSADVGGPAGVAGGDLSGNYPNPKVVRAAGNFDAADNIRSNSGEAGQVRLGARASGGEVAFGSPTDSYVYRKAAGVIGVDNYLDAALGMRVGGNALASTHLSDSSDIARFSTIGSQQNIFTAQGPYGPSVIIGPATFNPVTSGQMALLLRSGSSPSQTGNAQVAFSFDETNTYIHRIGTRHEPTVQAGNAIDFYVWQRATDDILALGTQHVLTLDATGSNLTGPLKLNDGMVDLTSVAATSAGVGTGMGDKIALYTTTYGIGLQSSRIVAWVGSPAGGLSVRQIAGAGAKSSGTDAVTLLGDGSGIFTGMLRGPAAGASTALGVTAGAATAANSPIIQYQGGGAIVSGLYAGFGLISAGTYLANATGSLGIRGIEFLHGGLTAGGGIRFYADAQATTAGAAVVPGTPRMRITGTGNVLIGHESDHGGRLVLPAGTTAADGLWWGADTQLYRAAGDTLRTDDNFIAALSGAIGQTVISANQRFTVATTVNDAASTQYGVRSVLSHTHAAASAVGLYAVNGEITISGTGGDTGIISGMSGFTTYNASGVGSNINGVQGSVTMGTLAGGISTARGAYFRIDNSHTTNLITNALGLVIANNIGVGAITNNYGIQIQALGGTGVVFGLDVVEPSSGTTRRAINLGSTSGLPSGGITFGSDTNLYRAAANALQTDDQLTVSGAAWFEKASTGATDFAFATRVSSESPARFTIDMGGRMEWGPGGGASRDTILYRAVQHTLPGLETDDPIRVVRTGAVNQHIQLTPGDAGGNYLDSWTAEQNKKHLYFRTIHGSEGAPAGGHGFDWQVGPASAPVTVATLSEAGAFNVAGASAGYSIGGVALKSTHLSDYANIAMLNENEIVTGGWAYQASSSYAPAGTTNPKMTITMGTAANPAYFSWWTSTGFRKAYLGWGNDTSLDMQVEAGARWTFSSLAKVDSGVENSTASFGSGAHTFTVNVANQRIVQFTGASFAGDVPGRTITNAATVAIVGPPLAGTNMTITSSQSLWVMAGQTRLDGPLTMPNATTAAAGIVLGGDVNLYRFSANELAIDDRLLIYKAGGTNAVTLRRSPSGFNVFNIDDNGVLGWADPAVGTIDTALYRGGVDQLRTDDQFYIANAGGLAVNTTPISTALINLPSFGTMAATGIQWGTSGPAIYSDAASRIRFNGDLYAPASNVAIGTTPLSYIKLRVLGTMGDDVNAGSTHYGVLFDPDWKPVNDLADNFWALGTSPAIDTTTATGPITGSLYGANFNMAYALGTQPLAAIYGLRVNASTAAGVGTVATVHTARFVMGTYATPVTTAYGVYVDAPAAGGVTGTLTGINIENMLGLGATTTRAIYVGGGNVRLGANLTTARTRVGLGLDPTVGQLQFTSSTLADDGIYFGTDTNLYRAGANELLSDGAYGAQRLADTSTAFYARQTGDAIARYLITAAGQQQWGAGGSSSRDIFWGRTSAGHLGFATTSVLDLSVGTGTSAGSGTGVGDKIALYSNTYGIGIQASRMVTWLQASGALAIRADNTVGGHHSAGTDAITLWATGKIDTVRAGKDTLNLTSTGTTVGMTIGGDTTLYRQAANILRTDDLFQVDQNAVTLALGDINTYGMGLFQSTTGALGIGSSSGAAWIQSFGRPLRLNNQGQLVYVDSGLSVAGGLTVTSGMVTLPVGSLNGNAIQDSTLPIGAFGFIFGGNNLLYNSGFEATSVADADPNSVAFLPWDGWFFNNATPSLLTKPTTETRASITLPQATVGIKNAANWTAPGTARIGATTFTFTGITTDSDGLVSLTGCAGGTGTFAGSTPITQDPQGVDANRVVGMGNNAVKLTVTASATNTYMAPTPTRYVPVEPLKSYTGSAYLGAAAAGKNAMVSIIWYDATRTATGVNADSAYQTVSSTGMTRIKVTGTAPAGAVYARVYPVFQAATAVAGDVYYVDSVMFSDGDMLFAYEPRADEILPGSINATMIQAGAIHGDAIVANFSITGKRIQTSPTGQRVVLEGDDASTLGEAGLGVYNAAGNLRVRLGEVTGMTLFSTAGISDPVLKLADTGGLMVGSPTGARTIFDLSGVSTYDSTPTLRVRMDAASGLTLRDTASNVQVQLSGTGGLQTIGSGGSVFFDSTGLSAYNSTTTFTTATQVIKIDRNTGLMTMGAPTGAFRMEFDRTSMRFYDSAGTLGLYSDFGGLRTSSTTTYTTLDPTGLRMVSAGIERVHLSGAAGLELQDTAGVVRVNLSATGGLKTTGATGVVMLDDNGLTGYNSTVTFDNTTQVVRIDRATGKLITGSPIAARMEADRTSLRFYDASSVQQFSVISGVLTTGTVDTGARVRIWSGGIASYDSSSVQRFLIDAASGVITLRDTAAVPRMQLSTTGGLKSFTGTGGTVIVDDTGIGGYTGQAMSTAEQTFKLDRATGLLTLGVPSPGRRMEADRTSMRYFNDSNVQTFSIINGVLTTGTADTGARVRMDNLGIKAYNAGGINTVAINSDGSATFTGTINLVGSTLQGAIGGDNLIYNSGFEILTGTGYDGWQILGGGTGSIVTNLSAGVDAGRTVGPGSKALKITTTGALQYAYVEATSAKRHPVVGGETYSMSAYIGCSVAGRTGYMSVGWYNSAGTQIGGFISVVAAVSVSSTGMTRLAGTAVAPGAGLLPGDAGRAVTATIRPVGGSTGVVSGDAFYFDNLMFQLGNVPTEYFPRSDELLAGTTWESNLNVNVSKVMMDLNGIRGYEAAGQSFNLATTGILTLGSPSPGARMEADRTSFRYFNSSNAQQFSIINGVLTTGTADSGQRVRLDSTGLKAYNAAGFNTVSINSDGTAQFANMGGYNLVSNSDFSDPTGTNTWQTSGLVASLELGVDNFIFSSTQGVKLIHATGGNGWIGKRDTVANRINVIGGRPYTQTCYIKSAAGNASRNIQHYFYWYDNANALITSISQTAYALPVIGSWFRTTPYTQIAPANARYAAFLTQILAMGAGEVYYIDGYQIEEGDIVTPYKPIESSVLSEVSVNAGVLTAGTLRGTTFETSANVNVSKVMFDATGLRGYDASAQSFNLATTGLLTLGKAAQARMEADRTSLRFFNDSNVQQLSIINGVLTTGTADTGARVRMDSTGIKAYNAAGVNTVQINSTGTAYFTGQGGGNLLPNSSAEVYPGQWLGYQGTLAQELTEVKYGNSALKITVVTAPAQLYQTTSTPTKNCARIEPGKTYTFSVWVKSAQASRNAYVMSRFADAAGTILAAASPNVWNYVGGVSTPLSTTAWTRLTATGIAPPNARYSGITVMLTDGLVGEIFYFDGMQIEEGEWASAYSPVLAQTLSEVSIDAGVITAGTFRGTTFETSANVNVSKVMFDTAGIRGYDATGQVFNLTTAGVLSLGPPSAAARVDVDRTSMRFYQTDGTTVGLYARAGTLSTAASASGARIDIDGATDTIGIYNATQTRVTLDPTNGLRLYDTTGAGTLRIQLSATGGLETTGATGRIRLDDNGLIGYNSVATFDATTQVVQISRAGGGKLIIGPPSGAARIEADRTAMTFYQPDGLTQGIVATAGKLVSTTSVGVARVEFDGVVNQFAAYDTTRQRLGIDGTNGMRLWDAAGVLGLQSSAGGLVTGVGANRAELLGDGLTLYSGAQQSIKLDAATGLMVAGTDLASQRIEMDLYGFRMFGSNNVMGVHSTETGWSTGVAPNGRIEMDAVGLRAIDPGDQTIFEVFSDGITPSYFRGALAADGGIIQPVTSDGTISDGNKYSWRDTTDYEVAFIGTAVEAGSDQYSEAVLSTPVLRNYWRCGEAGGLELDDSVGLAPLGFLVGAYTLGAPSLVVNEPSNTAITFTGAGGRASKSYLYLNDALGTPAGALNNRLAAYGGTWVSTGGAGADWATTTSDALFLRAGAVRTAVSDSAGKIALMGLTWFDDVKLTMQMGFEWLNTNGTLEMGFVARYVNATTYLKAIYRKTSAETTDKFRIEIVKVISGVPTTIATRLSSAGWPVKTYGSSPPTLTIDTKGKATFTTNAYAETPVTVTDPDLATGGVLATGKVGMWDMNTGTGSGTSKRIYYDFKGLSPAQDFQQASFTWEGWVNASTVDATDRIIFEVAPAAITPASGWRITSSTAGLKLWYINASSIWTQVAGVVGVALTAGQTTHLALHWGASSGGIQYQRYTIFRNGLVSATGIDTNAKNPNGYTHPLGVVTIGAGAGTVQPFLGTIDEVAWYSNTVANSQIKEHYDIGVSTGISDIELRAKVQSPGGALHEIVILDQDGNSDLYPQPVAAKALCLNDFTVTCTIPGMTVMPLDTIEYESHAGIFNLAAQGQPGCGEITFPEDGYYMCTAQWNVSTAAMAAPATIVDCHFEHGGMRRGEARIAAAAAGIMVNVSAQFYATAGSVMTFTCGTNKGGTAANGAGSGALPQYVAIAKMGGPKGDPGTDGAKGEPGYFENIYINYSPGAAVACATPLSTWNIIPLPTAAADFATPVGAFTRNADGTLTVRDAGYYLIECDVGASAAWATAGARLVAGINLDTPGEGICRQDGTNAVANSYPFSKLSGAAYINAGQKVVVSYFGMASAGSAQIGDFSITRVGAGPQGFKGDTGTPGAPGAKGDPGYYEYALEGYAGGASTSVAPNAWTRLPIGAVSVSSVNAADALRWNADGTVTILQPGFYSLNVRINAPSNTAGAGTQFGWWANDGVDATPATFGAVLGNVEIPAPTSGTPVWTSSYVWYCGSANTRIGIGLYNRGVTGNFFVSRFTVARLGAGAPGAKGDTGAVGPASNTNVPVATILQTAVPKTGDYTSAPGGFLFCDGTAVLRAGTYAALFAAIGTTYGAGDGSTTFNLPDLVGRFALGAGTPANPAVTGGTAHALGSKGGTETHVLTAAQTGVPAHSHGNTGTQAAFNTAAGGADHQHVYTHHGGVAAAVAGLAGGVNVIRWGYDGGVWSGYASGWSHAHTVPAHAHTTPAHAGTAATAHSNIPQFTTVNYMIKY